MTPPGAGFSPTPTSLPDRFRTVNSPSDLHRKAHARLAEKLDLPRNRHKPLSLVRQEARRVLELLCDQDAPTLGRVDRDRLIEDVLAEVLGLGPLEELFRDDAVQEILVLAPHQIINRKNGVWLPTSVRFRDAEQVRAVLARITALGEPLTAGPDSSGGMDVRIANGFRVLAVIPPDVLNHPPMALFVRGSASNSGVVVLGALSGAVPNPNPQSGRLSTGSSESGKLLSPPTKVADPISGRMTTQSGPLASPSREPPPDPFARIRQRITERIVSSLAAAGLYDLNQVPLPDLRRIVLAHVVEFTEAEKTGYDDNFKERLALEILAGMSR